MPAQTAQPDEPIHTLHVYMDLIQVPVLALDSDLQRMKPLDASKFRISLDSGPTFLPRTVRQQGDDPISLAILLDPDGEAEIVPKLSEAIAELAPGLLQPRDHVSVYTLDCRLIRTLHAAPADPATLGPAVDRGLEPWLERHQAKRTEPCATRSELWDSFSSVIRELAKLPGRRILLAVTNGDDRGSKNRWAEVRSYAQQSGVAVFGYVPAKLNPNDRANSPTSSIINPRVVRGSSSNPILPGAAQAESPLSAICQLSGGMVMYVEQKNVAKQLAKFVTTVRERYILEFSRARNDTPGEHGILVSVTTNPRAYVRPAGVIILLPGRAEDAETIPRDTTNAPQMGTHKPVR